MARKSLEITIPGVPAGDENRDGGKTFVLTEMPAMQAEKWATKAFFALAKSGLDVPPDIADQGLAGVAALGLKAFSGISFYDAEPLLDEMLGCVQIKEKIATRKLTPDDIEEVATLLTLRQEVLKIHVDFSKLAALSKSRQAAPAKAAAS